MNTLTNDSSSVKIRFTKQQADLNGRFRMLVFRGMLALMLVGLQASGFGQAQVLTAPDKLSAEWQVGSGANRSISLKWRAKSNGEVGFRIYRRFGDAASSVNFALIGSTSADINTFVDTTVTRTWSSTINRRFVYYRVRAVDATGNYLSGAAEVVTSGFPQLWPPLESGYDTDADGITDAVEVANQFDPKDWTDASGDSDGDLMPNVWEMDRGFSMSVKHASLVSDITVDASYQGTDTTIKTKTIGGAMNILAAANAAGSFPYKIIRVMPGIYRENVDMTGINTQIALIADRSSSNPKQECIIQGVANGPVIKAGGSVVLDGFVITRTPGTTGAALASSQAEIPVSRVSIVRMNNCIVRHMNTGSSAIVDQTLGRLVLSHCTFWMNSLGDGARAHTYSSGVPSATMPLESTARLRIQNCVLWNPINTSLPEIYSVGDVRVTSSISFDGYPGSQKITPGLTPLGYLKSADSAAASGGALLTPATVIQGEEIEGPQTVHVEVDIHGETHYRYIPATSSYSLPGRGADFWFDADSDQIPDFADSNPINGLNAFNDDDEDLLTELEEYLSGTSMNSSDSPYLTLEQAYRIFPTVEDFAGNFLTRSEAFSLFMPLNATPLRKVRIAPGGNIGMGEFGGGSNPAP